VLTFSGWQPAGKGYGQPIHPQRNFVDEQLRVTLATGGQYAWRDPQQPRMTLVALAGPDCAARCFEALSGMAKTRVMLNQNQQRLRLLYIGQPPVDAARRAGFDAYWTAGLDTDGKLAAFAPTGADSVSALLVESNGTALSYYPAGFDGTGLMRDVLKVVK
jgi:hypothetical protein